LRVVEAHGNATLVACVADGAGSAKFSDVGSMLACDTIIDCATAFLEAGGRIEDLAREDVLRWCGVALGRIEQSARARQCDVRELATTLCAAVVAPACACFFQIGDGAVILRRNGIYGVVFWPQTGEYANSTNFLTSENLGERMEFASARLEFADLALFTDGIERLALHFDSQTPHPPFFDPFFRTLRATEDYAVLNQALEAFLTSEPVRERSDDDKTLLLASHIADS